MQRNDRMSESRKRRCADRRGVVTPSPNAEATVRSPRRELPPWLVRALMAVVLAVTIASVATAPTPAPVPAVALESVVVYRLEVGCATALLSTLLVALFARGLVLGRVPTSISRDGVGWDGDGGA
jgi:hypothetical protein